MAALPVKPSSPPPCRVIPCQPHRQDTCHLRYDSSSETLGELPVRVLPIYFEVKAGRMFWREEPTSGLEPLTCSLRVIHQALQGFAGDCKCRIFRGVSFPCLASCCSVLRSRWYQSGIKRGTAPSQSRSLAHPSEVRPAPHKAASL